MTSRPGCFGAYPVPGGWDHDAVTIADAYLEFGSREARGNSPTYDKLCTAIAADDDLLELLASLPRAKQQPNLLFGVVRFLGGPVTVPAFHDFVVDNWAAVSSEVLRRAVQTNEIGRCAALMPVLASLPQPLALIDIGTSAGLSLFSDKYAYRYGDTTIGQSTVTLDCDAVGITLPAALPTVAWRAGVDLNPLDITDPSDAAWLEALVWPEQEHRRERLRAAIAIARADPPRLVRGGLETVSDLVARAPEGTTPVVCHTSVLYQVPPAERADFVETVQRLPGHWISVEGPDVVDVGDLPAPPDDSALNVLALDGKPLAWVRGHGQAMFGL
jgi:uncharacterized protein DUF2332